MTNPFYLDRLDQPGHSAASSARAIGELLKLQLAADPHFYLFSPDETTSNKLDAAYDSSSRAWALPTEPWDLPESPSGRIVELLSENTLFAALVGHVLSGEPAMLTSYEAFFSIITSQILQHLKFLTQSSAVSWRPDYPAANLLSTSTCWRQDHNGYSHQSPALISTLLAIPSARVNCLFPVDATAAAATFDFMLNSTNVVNLTTFNKTDEPLWIDSHHASFQFDNGGASIFEFASDPNPEFIFTAAGDLATRESLYAIRLLKTAIPDLRLRFVGINALSYDAIGTVVHPLSQSTFDQYFTPDCPIIANFHGYPATLRNIFSRYTNLARLSVHGYCEQGSTTTPFEMLSVNSASRYHLCLDLLAQLEPVGHSPRPDLVEQYQSLLAENTAHAFAAGLDLPEIINFTF